MVLDENRESLPRRLMVDHPASQIKPVKRQSPIDIGPDERGHLRDQVMGIVASLFSRIGAEELNLVNGKQAIFGWVQGKRFSKDYEEGIAPQAEKKLIDMVWMAGNDSEKLKNLVNSYRKNHGNLSPYS